MPWQRRYSCRSFGNCSTDLCEEVQIDSCRSPSPDISPGEKGIAGQLAHPHRQDKRQEPDPHKTGNQARGIPQNRRLSQQQTGQFPATEAGLRAYHLILADAQPAPETTCHFANQFGARFREIKGLPSHPRFYSIKCRAIDSPALRQASRTSLATLGG